MKALTLRQPYATLVAVGAKRIETRSWPTRYRSAIAIHAAASFPARARALCRQEPFRSALLAAGYASPGDLPLSAVLATCRILDCLPTQVAPGVRHPQLPGPAEPEWAFGDYSPGRFMWLLADVVPISPPVPAKGALGLWSWTEQP